MNGMDTTVTEARKDTFNRAATVFSGIDHSVSRYRWSDWHGRYIRRRGKSFAEYSRAKMIWLACLLCLSAFLIMAGFELCRIAVYGTYDSGRGYSTSVEAMTPLLPMTGGGN
jgi:hypothetical protein